MGVEGSSDVMERHCVEELVPVRRETGVPQGAHVRGQKVEARFGGLQEFRPAVRAQVIQAQVD
jgi:hypothetical protein